MYWNISSFPSRLKGSLINKSIKTGKQVILYKTILIPVTLETDEFVALKKAIELSDENEEINIHFIRCISKKSWLHFRKRVAFTSTKNSLLQSTKERSLNPSIYTDFLKDFPRLHVYSATIEIKKNNKELLNYINEHKIDLLILCEKSRHSYDLSISGIQIHKITRLSSCAILNIPFQCLNHNIRSILIPVDTIIPEMKMKLAISFAKKNKALINLVTNLDKPETNDSKKKIEIFYKTYKWLKECGYHPSYKIFERPITNEFLIAYAIRQQVDLLLLDPPKKSIFSQIMHQISGKMVLSDSTLYTLTMPG